MCSQNGFKEQNVALLSWHRRHLAVPSGICCSVKDISDLTKHLTVEKYFCLSVRFDASGSPLMFQKVLLGVCTKVSSFPKGFKAVCK